MPSFHFKGKPFLQNYHHSVKFHKLEPKKDKGTTKTQSLSDNLLIQGDNLKALKALLPTHSGKIKCIYIDPPYNTGNENWVYNDNVASPTIQAWLGKEVNIEDLARHDKWCCMMYPRLVLLRELLANDGVIFISIDDNEVHRLRMMMDEIFGDENFVTEIAAQLNPRGRTLDKFFAKTHEYILVYAKDASNEGAINLLTKTGKAVAEYNKEDDKGPYRELGLRNRNPVFNRSNRPNLYYPLYVAPETGSVSTEKNKQHTVEVFPRNSKGEDGCWTWGKAKAKKEGDLLTASQTREGEWRVFRKDYLYDDDGETAKTKAKALWTEKSINNQNGKQICNEIFESCPFDFPKSVDLVKKCLVLGAGENDIILDSFAGSGTTAHAVLQLNKEDGGNRKFILVECEDYADEITGERIRRVIKGVPTAKDKDLKKGLGGSFSYYELGEELEMDKILEGTELPSYEELARYAFFTSTGENWDEAKTERNEYYIGSSSTFEVYLLYEPDKEKLKKLALNLDFAMKAQNRFPNRQKLIFAPDCFMEEYHLKEYGIRFAQLSFEIYRMAE